MTIFSFFRPKNFLLFLAIIAITAKLGLSLAIFYYPPLEAASSGSIPQELITLTNDYRSALGLSRLTPNYRLTQAAVNKAADILAQGYFDHTSPEGKKFSQWIKDVGYKYFYVGENLAIDFDNAQDIFDAWLASPSHRENIIKPQYQEIGLAALSGKFKNHQTLAVVQLFGTRIVNDGAAAAETYDPQKFSFDNLNLSMLPASWREKFFALDNLERLNSYDNYFLMLIIGLYLITYAPKKRSQTSSKQPIINRYQANTPSEWRDK